MNMCNRTIRKKSGTPFSTPHKNITTKHNKTLDKFSIKCKNSFSPLCAISHRRVIDDILISILIIMCVVLPGSG